MFGQLLFPDGRMRRVSIDMPPGIEEKARLLVAAGWSWTIECHPLTQTVAMWATKTTYGDGAEETEAVSETCLNGPEVPAMVERLVLRVWGMLPGQEGENDGSRQ
jgi:hypothetical protein